MPTITVRLPADLAAALDAEVARASTTRTAIITAAVQAHVADPTHVAPHVAEPGHVPEPVSHECPPCDGTCEHAERLRAALASALAPRRTVVPTSHATSAQAKAHVRPIPAAQPRKKR